MKNKIKNIILASLFGVCVSLNAANYSISTNSSGAIGTIDVPPVTANLTLNVTNVTTNIVPVNVVSTVTNVVYTYKTNIIIIDEGEPVNESPVISMSLPVNNSYYSYPSSILLFATATDNDGAISKVEFYSNESLINSDNSAPYSYEYSPQAGTYSIKSVAYDNNNNSSTSSLSLITVTNTTVVNIGKWYVSSSISSSGDGKGWGNSLEITSKYKLVSNFSRRYDLFRRRQFWVKLYYFDYFCQWNRR
jgi:hypothetical protein